MSASVTVAGSCYSTLTIPHNLVSHEGYPRIPSCIFFLEGHLKMPTKSAFNAGYGSSMGPPKVEAGLFSIRRSLKISLARDVRRVQPRSPCGLIKFEISRVGAVSGTLKALPEGPCQQIREFTIKSIGPRKLPASTLCYLLLSYIGAEDRRDVTFRHVKLQLDLTLPSSKQAYVHLLHSSEPHLSFYELLSFCDHQRRYRPPPSCSDHRLYPL